MDTPWGFAQQTENVAPGITIVHTAGHGGIILVPDRAAAMPAYMASASFTGPSSYEEDCDWCMPVLVFEAEFRAYYQRQQHPDPNAVFESARKCLCNWHPDVYEKFYGGALAPEESYIRAKAHFYEANRSNWVAIAAFGDWHPAVPEGMVAVCARLGHDHEKRRGEERFFLVPASEYSLRHSTESPRFAFVIDPQKHREIEPVS